MDRSHHPRSGHRAAVAVLVCAVVLLLLPAAQAQTDEPPEPTADAPLFRLPFDVPAGPTTWLYEQHYGNTVSAYNFGNVWYASGQGAHFGIDLEARCGTPVVAIGDGVVRYVDAEGFGMGPHNLVIDHPGTGLMSLYGHLNRTPLVAVGDHVTRGQVVAETGDPDLTCASRPHLHLEIRNTNYTYAYNPIRFIDANWHMLSSIGPVYSEFVQDLDHPRQWLTIEDQPDVQFGANWLNHFARAWPVRLERQAPTNTPPPRHLDPLPEGAAVTRTLIAGEGWNVGPWWNPDDAEAVYLIDEGGDEGASVFRQPIDGSERTRVEPAPPPILSPDGSVAVRYLVNGAMEVTRRADGGRWEVLTQGSYPAVSPDNRRLLWNVFYSDILPGAQPPIMEVWISNLDGTVQRLVHRQSAGWSVWLDARRLLIGKRIPYQAEEQLYILDVDDPNMAPQLLGEYRFLRGVEVAPGGGRIAFYLPFQDDPNASGVYVQDTQIGSQPRKLDVFGSYEWRDGSSLYMLSYDPAQDVHTLGLYDVNAGSYRTLTDPATLPLRVANNQWRVSPDGARIAYVDPTDYGLYLLSVGVEPPPGAPPVPGGTPEASG